MVITRLVNLNILVVIFNVSAARVIKTHKKFDERSFTGAVVTYNSNVFTRFYSKRNIIKNCTALFVVLKAYMIKHKFTVSGRNILSNFKLDSWFISKERTDFIYEHAVFVSGWTKVCKPAHTSAKASCSVEQNNCIAVVERMKHCCFVNKISYIKSVNQKVTYKVVFYKTKPCTDSRNLFMLCDDVFICFFKFLFKFCTCIRVKSEFLCKILKIENTANIVALTHMRIYLCAVFVINFVEFFRNNKAHDE